MQQHNIFEKRRYPFLKDEWPILVSLIVISILYSLLAEALARILPSPKISPSTIRITSLTLSGILVFFIVGGWLIKKARFSRSVMITFASIVTIYLFSGVFLLIVSLPKLHGATAGLTLLSDAAIVWIINILLFAVWFWLIDGGGPGKRRTMKPIKKDFLFPQEANKIPGWEQWQPNYIDYLFMAFHNCSTFGPTDTYVLSRRCKVLVVFQVIISLITLTMFVARALSITT